MNEDGMQSNEKTIIKLDESKSTMLRILGIASIVAAIFPGTVITSIILSVSTLIIAGDCQKAGTVTEQQAGTAKTLAKISLAIKCVEIIAAILSLAFMGVLLSQIFGLANEILVNAPAYY